MVVDAGYETAHAVKNALTYPGDDLFASARILVQPQHTDNDVARWLRGRGLPVAWRHERLRTKAARAYRRLHAHSSRPDEFHR
jgi:hypothetical protein